MGGVEQVIHQIARGANKHCIQTDVLSLSPKRSHDAIDIDGYQVHRSKLNLQIASNSFSISAFGLNGSIPKLNTISILSGNKKESEK